MGIPAREMGDWDSDELILIQGIVDAWFEEDGGIVLVDYKTDFVLKGQEELLKERYRAQFHYYSRALEQMFGRPVKEQILYSFQLGEIPVERHFFLQLTARFTVRTQIFKSFFKGFRYTESRD